MGEGLRRPGGMEGFWLASYWRALFSMISRPPNDAGLIMFDYALCWRGDAATVAVLFAEEIAPGGR